jgi:hypothetical protein
MNLPFRRNRAAITPPASTAVLDAIPFEGPPTPMVYLKGTPAFLGTEDGQAVVRIGSGPDGHLVLRSADPRFCALMAGVFMDACDALNPVPAALNGGAAS